MQLFGSLTFKQKQDVRAALTFCKSKGVDDVEMILKKLENEIRDERGLHKKMDLKSRAAARKKKKKLGGNNTTRMAGKEGKCPECGNLDIRVYLSQYQVAENNIEIAKVRECHKCKWSELESVDMVENLFRKGKK